MKIIIITIKTWNIHNALRFRDLYKGCHEVFVSSKLTIEYIDSIKPDYIFFPHWSERIPPEIYQRYQCVLFHMTDLPFGRGGSPLQNLIERKIYSTKISAIKVCHEMDAGDVYLKEDLDISMGTANEILEKISEIIFTKMIPFIITNHPIPTPQIGEPTVFKRRLPEQSNMQDIEFNDVLDFIRMLDGEGYPPAFIDTGKVRITFKNAKKNPNEITGEFEIYERTRR